jgi:hypothetical protein
MLGHKGVMPGNGENYHAFDSDWTDITLEKIVSIMGNEYTYLTNESRWLTDGNTDQLVIFKTSQDRAAAMQLLNVLIRR